MTERLNIMPFRGLYNLFGVDEREKKFFKSFSSPNILYVEECFSLIRKNH